MSSLASDMITLLGVASDQLVVSMGETEPLDLTRLCAPLLQPGAFYGVGLNYHDHAAEMGRALPDFPPVFIKPPSAVAGPYDPIHIPADCRTMDYEGELGIVIGSSPETPTVDAARSAIAGYCVVNDLTTRALAKPDTLVLAKGSPGYGPFGPWITTADAVPNPTGLWIRTWVNGVLRQNSSTAQLHRNPYEIVAYLAQSLALQPGDIITTGSPGGSGHGLSPPVYLKAGDCVRVEIEGLGAIENRIEI